MSRALSSSTTVKRRYAAKVEKGENAWRREWSSFMSGVSLGDLRKGGGVILPKAANLEVEGENEGSTACTYAYLFSSPAEKKAARLAKQREEEEKRKKVVLQRKTIDDPLAHLSKHERALHDAKHRGLNVDGMTRKEVRQFLHLTTSKEQQEAEKHQGEFRPHELMDEKLQWYQQGPHPVDLISEKLVAKKAAKKGKQLGLRYNYLMPHPSWMAKREEKRRESVLVGLGRRYVFDDAGRMLDAFSMCEVATVVPTHVGANKREEGKEESEGNTQDSSRRNQEATGVSIAEALVDPQQACRSFVRAVVRDRKVAAAIKNANLTTSYISSSLVFGPSIGQEDAVEEGMAPTQTQKRARKEFSATPTNATKRSKMPSFEP